MRSWKFVVSALLVFLPASTAWAAPPSATTSAATGITLSSANLNGTGTPAGEATTGWFRYSETNPGTCNDTFGTRLPAASGTDLGTGAVAVPYSILANGLSSGVTYYYCAIVANASGTAYGTIFSFTVPGPPVVTTSTPTAVTSSGATLQGAANPAGAASTGWYRYSTSDPGTCNDSFGTRAPTSSASDTSLGSGTSAVAYSRAITGLTPATTYYACAIAQNAYATSFGSVVSFTTAANAPTVTTNAPSVLSGTGATLSANVNPGGAATSGWFRYATTSPGTCNDSFGTRAPSAGGNALGSGNASVALSQAISGLTASSTYYVCAIAQNSVGTSFGSVVTFTTPTAPAVTTMAATSISSTSAYLNGSANPNRAATTGWFRFSTTNPGTCNDTFGSRAPASGGTALGSGSSASSYYEFVSGLSSGITYYYCAIAQNSEGLAFGTVMSFATTSAPLVTTTAATSVTSSTATLNGSASPNGDSAYGYFRYATSDPGTCNDSFGTRAPSTSASDTSLGSGTSAVAYTRGISVSPATTYYYCAIARNGFGTAFGAVMSFTSPAAAPTVSTGTPSPLTGTGGTLTATVNPGGAATTGWFRYSTVSPGSCNDTFGTRAPTTGGNLLGSGTSSVALSQAVTGLTANTTYYVCAIAQNSVATTLGSVVSFTTPTLPVVTTVAASSISSTAAYINGTANPNRAATTGWFRYASTNPGTCNDTFGSRMPASGGTALGSGASASAFYEYISGLSLGTTYYYCAIAQNSEGFAYGAVMSFTTISAPTVLTSAATSVTSTAAALQGSANPNGDSAYGYFRYATVDPGMCNDTFGTRTPSTSSSDTSLGAGTAAVPYSRAVTGLLPGTTYYYCAIGRNGYGTSVGAVMSFTTPAAAPVLTTNAPSATTGTTATLSASVNPGGAATDGWFRYSTVSPGTCNDSFGTRAPTSGGNMLGSGTSYVALSQLATGLTPNTTYYVCAIAQNSVATTLGSVISFTTPTLPVVTTVAASSVSSNAAYINGTANPMRSATTGWFRYSPTDPGTCNDSFGSRAPATGGTALGSGASAATFYEYLSGLSSGVTYYYCAIAQNGEGFAYGAVMSFTTVSSPSVTTLAATSVTSTAAALQGSANPNGDSAYGYFRYATVDPGACNDSFGTRTPSTSSADTSLGAGTAAVPFSRAVTGLLPGTTYYYCAIGRNGYGTGFGALQSFTTPAAAPVLTTNAPSATTGTTATLSASVNPGGAATSGWFRYSTVSPGTCNDTFGTRAPTSGGNMLGSGTSYVALSQLATGLTPNTTYYVCAIAQNSVATTLGSVISFTTPTLPVVTTVAASSISSNAAYINGTANPMRSATTGWFRYSPTDPGTCNDSFGSRAPATGGTALGSGASASTFYEYLSGLSQGVTYYYCAIAQNGEGFAYGTVMSFTTVDAPSVTTTAATGVASSSANLNGTAVPNGDASYGYFRYAAVSPGACNDTFGTRTPSTSASDTSLGNGTASVPFSRSISGLSPGSTYYYCAIGRNGYGTRFGTLLSFTTPAAAPSVSTLTASGVTTTAATLNASANPNGASANGWFRYATVSPGTCNDTFGTRLPTSGAAPLGGGSSSVAFGEVATGLTPGVTYYYCAIASNTLGTSFGSVLTFTTPAPPTVSTLAATPVTSTSATLNASINANGQATTAWYRYGIVNPGSCSTSFGTPTATVSVGSATSVVANPQPIAGLSPGTTYYFCALADSAIGTTLGGVLSFTTPGAAPGVTTLAASGLSPTGAQLNGNANPNGGSATGWFRYATTSPGACNDTFGTRTPATGGTALGSGTVGVPFSTTLSGLTTGITYYYCAIASNGVGVAVGSVLTFTTSAVPTVTTVAATGVSATTGTLAASVNPNGTAALGWFRYATTDPGSCNDSFGTRSPASGGTSLGSGATAVPVTQPLTGLTPGATYYYCALASNTVGTSFGSVMSFTTAIAPTVATNTASGVSTTGATFEGSANPNSTSATGWFRYAATDPGSCSDTFGIRVPATGGTPLGSGTTAVAYSQGITGLAPATTYYYCAIAQNAAGTGLGSLVSFTTLAAPAVTTVAVSALTSTSVTLEGSANPNLGSSTGWFRYATTSPGACNDAFGTRAPAGSGGTSLGAGASSVSYSEPVSGLVAGTTYYYCAIAQNPSGTAFGSVLSFTTPAVPDVTTSLATAVSSMGATLQGSADPNLSAATGWFRYATTNPGSCNDVFGTRAPTTGGTSLGAAGSAVPYSQVLTGLTAGTTYYYCAIAQNGVGLGFGVLLSFTTSSAPSVTTSMASAVTSTGATLEGAASPRGSAATGWFRWSTTDPGTCNDTFGARAPITGGTSLGSGSSPVPFTQMISGLAPATTYYYCAIASNTAGTAFGTVSSFTTQGPPVVTTNVALAVTGTGATLSGSASPNGASTTGWFRYGTTSPGATCSELYGMRAPTTGGAALGSGTSPVDFTQAVTGLSPGTTYYYCAVASSSAGSGLGAVMSFTTPAPPTMTTDAATLVSSTGATLNGSGNPNGASATAWFRYDLADPGTCDDTFGARAPSSGGTSLGSGTSASPYTQALTGLSPGSTYYFCAIGASALGTSFGAVRSFTTPSAPTVTTAPATSVGPRAATLEGSARPNGADTSGWFRYATTMPTACDDAFGTRAPAAGGTSLGSGTSDVPFTQALTALLPATTYYYCAIASNAAGTRFGEVRSFTTPDVPTVVTHAASAISSGGATLNASANPHGADATGWFRYDVTRPTSCDDAFGIRTAAPTDTALGAGTAEVPYAVVLSGLSPMTTYYFCAIASNAAGTGFGAIESFTTPNGPAPPSVVTDAATDRTGTSATLNASVTPNLADSVAWFRYDTTEPVGCDDTFGTRAPSADGTAIPAGSTAVPVSEAIADLSPATTYYFCAIASNARGTTFGTVESFTTEAGPPSVTTNAPTAVTAVSADLNGAGIPNGADTTGWFRYDTTDPGACDDTFGMRAPASDGTALGDGTAEVVFTESIDGLTTGTTYYFCAIAENANGMVFGELVSFVPGAIAPDVTTEDASAVMATSATLNGTANPNATDATGWFRYGTTEPTTCDDTYGMRAPATDGTALGAGSDPVAFLQDLADLEPAQTYYYCAAAQNSGGASFGEVRSFTTEAAPPTVTTTAAIVGAVGMVTLNGTVDPQGTATTSWFRYDTADPGACDDTFGWATDPTDAGSARVAAPFSAGVTDLAPGTYWVCAIAQNASGTAFGDVLTFEITEGPAPAMGGCGCRVGAAPQRAPLVPILGLALGLLLLARRRAR